MTNWDIPCIDDFDDDTEFNKTDWEHEDFIDVDEFILDEDDDDTSWDEDDDLDQIVHDHLTNYMD